MYPPTLAPPTARLCFHIIHVQRGPALSLRTRTLAHRATNQTVNRSLWPLKFLAVSASLLGVLFLPEPALFGVYAEVARVLSLVWMLFQVRTAV